jgi:hypothetical protein
MARQAPRIGRLLAIAACLSLWRPGVLPAVTFHVAPHGADAGPGTESQPFATLGRARQAVRAINATMRDDIVVLLHGGVYPIDRSITFGPEDSGFNGHNVIYRAAPNETPVFSGGKRVVGWTPDEKGRWKAPAPADDFRQLYVGGVRVTRAKGPPPAGLRLFGPDGYKTTAVETARWRNPGDIEFCYRVVWTHSRCRVQDIRREGDEAVITMLQPQFTQARTKAGARIVNPDAIYVENALELLDEPGEWYLDRSARTVYYMPRPGEDISTIDVIAPVVETLVALRGTLDKPVRHIALEGVSFQYGNWLRPSRIGHCDVQANFITDSDKNLDVVGGLRNRHNENLKSPANVLCHAAKSVRFERCTFARLGGAGLDIEFGSQDNAVVGCRFFDIAGTAIQVGDVLRDDHHPDDPRRIVKHNSVVNCVICDCCLDYMGGVGVFAGYTEATRIAHNEIFRLPYTAISVGWGWGMEDAGGGAYQQPHRYDTPTPAKNNRIECNNIHHVMSAMDDGGGVYTLGRQPGTVIRGNFIHDCKPAVGGRGWLQGIYLDEGSADIEVVGNLVRGMKPLACNNKKQNRIAACNIHDNIFGGGNSYETLPPSDAARAKAIAERAGPEPEYRDGRGDQAKASRYDFHQRDPEIGRKASFSRPTSRLDPSSASFAERWK